MDDAEKRFILRWRESGSSNRTWHILGLDSQGRFFGELTRRDPANRLQTSLEGTLTSAEIALAIELIEYIRAQSPDVSRKGKVTGVLAEGPRSSPVIIYKHSPSSEDSPSAKAFFRLAELITQHVVSRRLIV